MGTRKTAEGKQAFTLKAIKNFKNRRIKMKKLTKHEIYEIVTSLSIVAATVVVGLIGTVVIA